MKARTLSLWISIALIFAVAASASAMSYLYAGKRKKVNCGVVWIPGATQPTGRGLDDNGYTLTNGGAGDLFFLLDMRTDMKPAGWSLENPLAQGSPSTGLGKNNPEYWKVDLRSATDLSRMHVLYLPASGTLSLSPQDREKLRQFVDGGGVLWIDNSDPSNCLVFGNTFFILKFGFESASGTDFPSSRHHPLLSLPYWLTDSDIAMLGDGPNCWGKAVCKPGYDGSGLGSTSPPTEFDVLYPVVGNTGLTGNPSMAANAYGSGRVVATSTFVGGGCYLNYPFSMPSTKFAYNVIAWASSWTHLRKDPRHSGSSIDTVGGTKLLEFWSLPVTAVAGGSASGPEYAPVIYKNVVFYTNGGTLYAMDLFPQEDLDNDGNPDDGHQGVPIGWEKGEDIIWYFDDPDPKGGGLSAPTIATILDPAQGKSSIDAVLVQSKSGTVYMLEAFPYDGAQLMPTWKKITEWPIGVATDPPYPPIYVNGWIYATAGDGRLYAYSPALEAWYKGPPIRDPSAHPADWKVPGASFGGNASLRTGPSFGFVKSEATGANVGMIYWFGGPWQTPPVAPGAEQNDHVYGVPIFVANDKVKVERSNAVGSECRTSYRDGFVSDMPKPVVQIVTSTGVTQVPDGQVKPNRGIADYTTVRPGYIRIDFPIPSDALVYATYALDYASQGSLEYAFPARVRQPLEPRSNAQNQVPKTQVAATPAIGPDAMIYLAGRREGAAPAVYGIKNDGTSQYSRWNYLLHPGVKQSSLGGVAAPLLGLDDWGIPGVVYGSDGLPMERVECKTSPAVSGDKVFVTVKGVPGGPKAPSAALLCFKADSQFVIQINENAGYGAGGQMTKRAKRLINGATGQEMQVKIWQPNMLTPDVAGPTIMTPLLNAQVVRRDMINHNAGTITFSNFDLMKLRSGVMLTSTFTSSLPVFVFLDNVEVPIDWNTWSPFKSVWSMTHNGAPVPAAKHDSVDLSGWNNLLWYFPVTDHACGGTSSSPIVIGNTVYFTCNDGYLYALPTETGESSGGPIDKKLLIWQAKINGSAGGSSTGTAANMSIAGSNGVLLIPASDGLHAYTNATTLVADSNRLVEMDGAGEIRWSMDSISWPISQPPNPNTRPPVTSGPINKPSRAKYLPSGEILIVNSGASQVCRVDKTGNTGLGKAADSSAPDPNNPFKYFRGVYDRFHDPKGLLRPGQPTSLSAPTDAIFRQEYEIAADGSTVRVDHCVIADSGNHRIVDLVYKFATDTYCNPVGLITVNRDGVQPDPNTGFFLPELNWVSVTDSTNERYVYDCVQLVPNTDGSNDIHAAVSNYRGNLPAGGTLETSGLGGAIFALQYRIPNGAPTQGCNNLPVPRWNYAGPNSGRVVAACDRAEWGASWGGVKPLACPRYFEVSDRPETARLPAGRYLLICDNHGVYEVGPLGKYPVDPVQRFLRDQDPLPNSGSDYRTIKREVRDLAGGSIVNMTPPFTLQSPLVANSVQELPNGNWLITNGYSGTDTSGARTFSGEVFELSFDQNGVPNGVPWSSPPLCIDTATLGATVQQRLQNGYILQQPRSAARQF